MLFLVSVHSRWHNDSKRGRLSFQDWKYGQVPMDLGVCGGHYVGPCYISDPDHDFPGPRAPLEVRPKQHRL